MNPTELSCQLRGVFEQCDPAGLGFISLESLLDLGSELLNPDAHEEVKKELLALDTRATGQIDFDAFCSVVATVLAAKIVNLPDTGYFDSRLDSTHTSRMLDDSKPVEQPLSRSRTFQWWENLKKQFEPHHLPSKHTKQDQLLSFFEH